MHVSAMLVLKCSYLLSNFWKIKCLAVGPLTATLSLAFHWTVTLSLTLHDVFMIAVAIVSLLLALPRRRETISLQ
jgi:hypothetical protein